MDPVHVIKLTVKEHHRSLNNQPDLNISVVPIPLGLCCAGCFQDAAVKANLNSRSKLAVLREERIAERERPHPL